MDKIKAKRKYNFNDTKPVLAVLGGSQGSLPLNNHYQKYFKQYTRAGIQILWQCGSREFKKLQHSIHDENVRLFPFTDEMGPLYSAADLVVSRAGALALSEIAIMGKAMVLVPFPYAAGNHQSKNAKTFTNSGAAVLIPQTQLSSGDLEATVMGLINNPDKLKQMEKNSLNTAKPNALNKIAGIIMELAES